MSANDVTTTQSDSLPLPLVLAALLVLLVLTVGSLLSSRPPAAGRGQDDPESFSSTRALAHLAHIARAPHPAGSAEHAVVRDYLVRELSALGLQPEVQSTFSTRASDWGGWAGEVHNVVVRVPGTAGGGKALLLAAHYDSVHTGPGAADNGASVAAALETLRALGGSRLRNDVIVLFSDSEEFGLLGAAAFVERHPWAKQVELALNFEFRGNAGPVVLFETSDGNGPLVAAYAAEVPHAMGSSLWSSLYQMMPNSTDMNEFKRVGWKGLNFAASEGHTNYHTALDSIERLDQRSLQQTGETMLALVRHFGSTSLDDLDGADRVYFDSMGLGVLTYPVGAVLPLLAFVLMLVAVTVLQAIRRAHIRTSRALLALPLVASAVGLTSVIGYLGWATILATQPALRAMYSGDAYANHWYLLANAFAVFATCILIWNAMKRWFRPIEIGIGAILLWALLLIASSVLLPGASYLFAWPLLATCLALTWLVRREVTPTFVCAALLLGAVPGIVLFAPLVWSVHVALTPSAAYLTAALIALVLALNVPLLGLLFVRKSAVVAAVALAAVCIGLGSLASRADADHPHQSNLFYAQIGDGGKAFWLSDDEIVNRWSGPLFAADAEYRAATEVFGKYAPNLRMAPAPQLLKAPSLEVLSDETDEKVRKLSVRVVSERSAPRLMVSVDAGKVLRADVQGQRLTDRAQETWVLHTSVVPSEGLVLSLEVESAQPLRIRLMDTSFGLPADLVQPRPPELIAQPSRISDVMLAVTEIEL